MHFITCIYIFFFFFLIGKKGVFKTNLKFNKTPDIVKEKNFPRTPKKSPIKCSSNFVNSETKAVSPQVLTKRQLKKLKRKFNNQGMKMISFYL